MEGIEGVYPLSIEECDINGWLNQDANYEMNVGYYEDMYNEEVVNPDVQEVPNLEPSLDDVPNIESILEEEPNLEPILEEEPNLADILEEEPNLEPMLDEVPNSECVISYDPANPKIELNALFPDSKTFRSALKHFAILNQFVVDVVKCDTRRYIGKCHHDTCPWRIRASILQNNKTFMVRFAFVLPLNSPFLAKNRFMVRVLPHAHTCPSTTMVDGKMVSQSWLTEWIRLI